jgi:hypothetical protein
LPLSRCCCRCCCCCCCCRCCCCRCRQVAADLTSARINGIARLQRPLVPVTQIVEFVRHRAT